MLAFSAYVVVVVVVAAAAVVPLVAVLRRLFTLRQFCFYFEFLVLVYKIHKKSFDAPDSGFVTLW